MTRDHSDATQKAKSPNDGKTLGSFEKFSQPKTVQEISQS
jgi:hypothetical protein